MIPRHHRQRGFTLIELMVALVISALLVGMILAIALRMSLAYRGQQQITTVQSLLASARIWIERDAKQAGFGMAQGFRIATDGTTATGLIHAPVEITNSSTGPDEIGFYYADATVQALVVAPTRTGGAWPAKVIVDDPAGFAVNDLVVLSTATLVENPLNPTTDGMVAQYHACVVRIASISGTDVVLSTSAPWGVAGQDHCSPGPVENTTMMYKFVARSYRIDTARPDEGVLQLSSTGGLNVAALYEDIGFGFTDLQVAGYFYDNDGIDTADPDADGARDWVSSDDLVAFTEPRLKTTVFAPLLQLGVSLVARTTRSQEGIVTAYTPVLTDVANPTNNMLGDREAIDLSATSDPRLQGNRIYRHATFYVDLRNVGVGR